MMDRRWRFSPPVASVAVALLLLCGACASQSSPPASSLQAVQAATEIPENQLLDVGLRVLDSGLPPEGETIPEGVFPELRKAEARYFAVQLEKTMQATGQWGAVRVLPTRGGTIDLEVSGKILHSTGSKLVLEMRAADATGRVWIDDRYRGETDGLAYQTTSGRVSEPFQTLYNEIANDLLEARRKLSQKDLAQIRQVARLRFAADLAPIPFEEYLGTDRKGRISPKRLPSSEDPMMARIDSIRSREDLFIDTLDQNYAAFYATMEGPYGSWRKYTFEEEQAYKKLRRKALTQKIVGGLAMLGAALANSHSPVASVARDVALIGGMAAIQAGIATSQEAKIHAEALKELAASVETEVAPMVIEVEGQALRLSGTAETQFETWRRLLHEIWISETGLPQDPNAAPPGAGAPAGE
ncbi:MAG: hypothetical protein ACC742_04650 [Thermoanaerobaculales bacterium]